MKPDISHDLVNDFTVKTAENNCTVASTSLSRPLKIWPKINLSSAACSHRITPITMASCNKGNLTMLRIGAKISLIIRWVLLVDLLATLLPFRLQPSIRVQINPASTLYSSTRDWILNLKQRTTCAGRRRSDRPREGPSFQGTGAKSLASSS